MMKPSGKASLKAAAEPRPDIALLLAELGHECSRRIREALAELNLKPRHVHILELLTEDGPVGQRELGEALGVDHSLLITFLNPMEADGLIRRRRSCQDRRRHLVSITRAGERRRAEAMRTITAVQATLLAPLERAQCEHLRRLLEAVRAERGDDHDQCD